MWRDLGQGVFIRDTRVSFFCFGAGQKKFFSGLGVAGQLVKSSERDRVTVKLGAFSGWRGAGHASLKTFISFNAIAQLLSC